MKKRLITSLILTLVIVLSMSTATFAWYTASQEATATATITAATADSNILLSTTGTGNWANELQLEGKDNIQPLAPIEAYGAAQDFGATANWVSGQVGSLESGKSTPVIYTFYAANQSSSAIDLKIDVTVPEKTVDTFEYVVVAAPANGNAQLVASTLYSTTNTTEGFADAGAITQPTFDNVVESFNDESGNITITVYAWFNGWEHNNTHGGGSFDIQIDFTKAQAQS